MKSYTFTMNAVLAFDVEDETEESATARAKEMAAQFAGGVEPGDLLSVSGAFITPNDDTCELADVYELEAQIGN